MKLSGKGELALIESLRKKFTPKSPLELKASKGLLIGIGDDAAAIAPERGKSLLLTSDLMTEGVHFDLAFMTPAQLGFKLVSVNVSDIYAMGGTAHALLLSLAFPPQTDQRTFDDLYKGIAQALRQYSLVLAGGDLCASTAGMMLSATLTGYAKRPITRSGARPGDGIYVTGPLGDSALGLAILKRMGCTVDFKRPCHTGPVPWSTMAPLVRRHLMPEVTPIKSTARITAMMDISDGLSVDLHRLCKASSVGARIYEDAMPLSPHARAAASALGRNALDMALTGGEDYELLFTAPAGSRTGKAIRIGEITNRDMYIIDIKGKRKPLKPEGYKHFAQDQT